MRGDDLWSKSWELYSRVMKHLSLLKAVKDAADAYLNHFFSNSGFSFLVSSLLPLEL